MSRALVDDPAAPPIHVVRHESPIGRWETHSRAPAASLRQFVDGSYIGWSEQSPSGIRRREVPSDIVPLILNLGSPYAVGDAGRSDGPLTTHHSFVAGLYDTYVLVDSTRESYGLQVNLTPIGAYLVLGLPMRTLTNRTVAFEDVVGATGRLLMAQLHDATSWAARFARIDAFIIARLADAPPASPGVVWAAQRLTHQHGLTPISPLASALGWSRKHLIAQFHEQIGLPPKTLARILRFKHAINLINRSSASSWTDIALDCGYFDQAHFNRDFREFAGVTPTEFLVHRLPDNGGVGG